MHINGINCSSDFWDPEFSVEYLNPSYDVEYVEKDKINCIEDICISFDTYNTIDMY